MTEVGRDDKQVVWVGEIPRQQLSVRLFPVERQRADKDWHNGELTSVTTHTIPRYQARQQSTVADKPA